MITITPTAQLIIADSSTSPSTILPVAPGGLAVMCPTGYLVQDVDLAADTDEEAPAFPIGVSVAKVLWVLPVTATDLVLGVGPDAAASLSVPIGQPQVLYNVPVDQIVLSSSLGGKIQYAVGG